ncbi:hypothetical protein Pcinc_026712 [Petrolisthes cinctipes]|uniref:Uncharacterized protein n=1 Tax=Petrolisthes cinctipes TaxID=88211 RepID=A0AAE1F5J6_PETCI|nr:hypothetical protein Pcinc_026712 [Petrolisthes cinctipes]
MHIGQRTQQANYQLNGRVLQKSTQEDLGIEVSSNLKFSAHAAKIAAKANSRLGIIKRNFTVLSEEILVPLYLTFVRPILVSILVEGHQIFGKGPKKCNKVRSGVRVVVL